MCSNRTFFRIVQRWIYFWLIQNHLFLPYACLSLSDRLFCTFSTKKDYSQPNLSLYSISNPVPAFWRLYHKKTAGGILTIQYSLLALMVFTGYNILLFTAALLWCCKTLLMCVHGMCKCSTLIIGRIRYFHWVLWLSGTVLQFFTVFSCRTLLFPNKKETKGLFFVVNTLTHSFLISCKLLYNRKPEYNPKGSLCLLFLWKSKLYFFNKAFSDADRLCMDFFSTIYCSKQKSTIIVCPWAAYASCIFTTWFSC